MKKLYNEEGADKDTARRVKILELCQAKHRSFKHSSKSNQTSNSKPQSKMFKFVSFSDIFPATATWSLASRLQSSSSLCSHLPPPNRALKWLSHQPLMSCRPMSSAPAHSTSPGTSTDLLELTSPKAQSLHRLMLHRPTLTRLTLTLTFFNYETKGQYDPRTDSAITQEIK